MESFVIEPISPIIDFFKRTARIYKNYENDMIQIEKLNDEEIDKKMEKFHKDNIPIFEGKINESQNDTVLDFYNSGIQVNTLDKELRKETLQNINIYANNINVDYHPGSEDKVRDIVHPSMYPYIQNYIEDNEKTDFWGRPYENSKYQWLPSEFKIDKNGKCKIDTYINNLPITELKLYKNIENIFEQVLPYFENMWSYTNSAKLYDEDNIDFLLKRSSIKYKQLSLKKRNLQVITKIVKVTLKEGQELIGAWHVEGMSHENIIGTVSVTLEQTENFQAELSFKRIYTEAEAKDLHDGIRQNAYYKLQQILNNTLVPLGKVNIKESNIVSFPNSHIHKIDMKNIGKDVAERTILVFWLINPKIRIKSTRDIDQQDYDIEKAKKHRLELMKERTYHKQTFNQRDLNLCEH